MKKVSSEDSIRTCWSKAETKLHNALSVKCYLVEQLKKCPPESQLVAQDSLQPEWQAQLLISPGLCFLWYGEANYHITRPLCKVIRRDRKQNSGSEITSSKLLKNLGNWNWNSLFLNPVPQIPKEADGYSCRRLITEALQKEERGSSSNQNGIKWAPYEDGVILNKSAHSPSDLPPWTKVSPKMT